VSRPIALVSARVARGLDEDERPLTEALRSLGAAVEVADWDDPGVDWGVFELALLRSTWDYAERIEAFLEWAQRACATTRLVNPLPVVRWNTDKHYLRELSQAGVPTVPGRFIEPEESAAEAVQQFLAQHACAEVVVKPAVGAGSRDVRRHERGAVATIIAHAQRLLAARRSVLLQPYLARVDEEGETALIYLDGGFSHAVRKGPLLSRGAEATPGLFAPEQISPRVPALEETSVAQRALAALPFPPPLYARIDLIRDEEGKPRLLELELTEPSLFFAYAPGAVERLAARLLELVVRVDPSQEPGLRPTA
jgi:glutathione synthase/RimK-type ligase-like ATP-grasp enzyme